MVWHQVPLLNLALLLSGQIPEHGPQVLPQFVILESGVNSAGFC
jgi:hypothetical protein